MWGGDLVHLLKGAEAIWLLEGKPSLLIKDQNWHYGPDPLPLYEGHSQKGKHVNCLIFYWLKVYKEPCWHFYTSSSVWKTDFNNIGKWFKGICPFGLKVLLPQRLKWDGGLSIILNQQYSGPSEKSVNFYRSPLLTKRLSNVLVFLWI